MLTTNNSFTNDSHRQLWFGTGFSNIAGTVFLMAEGGNDFTSLLNWIDYSGWPGITGNFYIYMSVNGVINGAPIASVAGDTLAFEDDVSDFPVSDGNICYIIQAVEAAVNSYGFKDYAFSNEACARKVLQHIFQTPLPQKAKIRYSNHSCFSETPILITFKVFNRWVSRFLIPIFQPKVGMELLKIRIAPAGIYAYQLIFKGFNKKEVRRIGTVMLVR
jgi:hypothetical protein